MSLIADSDWNQLVDSSSKASLWVWLGVGAVVIGSFVIGKIISVFFHSQAKRLDQNNRHPVGAIVMRSIGSSVGLLVLGGGLYGATMLFFQGELPKAAIVSFWLNVCRTLVALAVGFFFYRLVDVVEHYLRQRSMKASHDQMNTQIMPLIRKILQTIVIVVTVLFIAQNIFDWQIGALLAGLGIGGLAVALAAQQTLSNLFGSITIFTDRPFQLHDTVKIRTYFGMIEDVGFRSTRLRTVEGTLITIPNSIVANEVVETFGYHQGLRQEFSVSLKNSATPEKLRKALQQAGAMLKARSEQLLQKMPPRAYLSALGAGTVVISVSYWVKTDSLQEFCGFNQEFYLELVEKLKCEGIDLA